MIDVNIHNRWLIKQFSYSEAGCLNEQRKPKQNAYTPQPEYSSITARRLLSTSHHTRPPSTRRTDSSRVVSSRSDRYKVELGGSGSSAPSRPALDRAEPRRAAPSEPGGTDRVARNQPTLVESLSIRPCRDGSYIKYDVYKTVI